LKLNWRLIAGILISIAALWVMAREASLDQFSAALARADYALALASIVFIVFSMWVRGYRWRALLDNRITAYRSFNISNIGNLLNNVFPLRLGEVARAYLVSRSGEVALMQCFSTIIVERLLDVLVVLGMLMVVLPFVTDGELFARAGTITAAVAFLAVITLLVVASWRDQVVALARRLLAWLPPAVREPLIHQGDQFLVGIRSIRLRRLASAAVLSMLIWGGWAAGCHVMLAAFVPDLPWYVGVLVTCAVALGLSIPSAPSGAGLFEAAVVAALALFDIPLDTSLAYAVLLHLSCIALAAILGVYALAVEGQSFAGITDAARNMLAARK
jgi:uncharacterized protein (TIRG00374 family)